VTKRGRLEFRLIDASMTAAEALAGQPPRGSEVLYDDKQTPFLVEKEVQLSGSDLAGAESRWSKAPVVAVRFASDKFGEVTAANVGRSLAIVFDGKVLAAPMIREPIPTRIMEIGPFTVEQSLELAMLLRAGELPGRLVVLKERTGPQTVKDERNQQ
jgi:preprotein translocase subunit SecD